MIEELQSFSGHRSLRLNGRLVASREDPIREATRWVEFNRFRFVNRKNVFVLGVGCAYHLELLAQEPGIEKVIGIEHNRELFDYANLHLAYSPLLAAGKIKIFNSQNVGDLNHKDIYTCMGADYAVLKFFPATAMSLKTYEDFFYTLLGRNQSGIELIIKARKDFQSDLKNISVDSIISIKQILPNTKNVIWQTLAELVK